MRKLIIYLKPFKKQCIIGPICKLLEAIIEILLPTIMAVMINEGIVKNDYQIVMRLGILMIIMVVIGFGFSLICQHNAALASQGFGTNMRNILFQKITTFSYDDIDHFTTSSLNNRLTNDVNQMQLAVAMLIRLVIRSPFIIIGTIIISMSLDVQLSLILLASIPFISIILFVFIKLSTPCYRTYQKLLDRFANLLDDHLAGVRLIRAFVTQRQERQRFNECSDDLQAQMLKVSRLSALLNPLSSFVVNAAIMVLLYTGLLQIGNEHMPPGNLIAFINYATQILLALVAVSNLIVIFTKASASAGRIHDVLQYEPLMKEGTNVFHNDAEIVVSFQHVSFHYGNGEDVLHDISFDIYNQQTIGIIGSTGSGKSTLGHLLCRFYDSDQGTIKLFDHPIYEYTYASLRKRVTTVPQTNELFKGTIRDNLWFGLTPGDDTNLLDALADAQALSFVMALDKGLDAWVERGGTNFSGGQRQRLCIARALLRDSEILLLDDASNALDFQTEALLRQALKKRQQTLILISQRIATILQADKILVLDNGGIVGFDRHEALYDSCSIYRELCDTQKIARNSYVK